MRFSTLKLGQMMGAPVSTTRGRIRLRVGAYSRTQSRTFAASGSHASSDTPVKDD